jgi:hypothetical protein
MLVLNIESVKRHERSSKTISIFDLASMEFVPASRTTGLTFSSTMVALGTC